MQGARRVIARAWAIYAHMAGLAVLAVGGGLALVTVVAQHDAVVEPVGVLAGVTYRVPAGGTLSYSIDIRRRESCAGQWTAQLISITNHGPPAVVTITRPTSIASLTPGLHTDIRTSIVLPEAVHPGRWHYESGVTSRCPTRTRYDRLAAFDFEVTP